VRRLLDDLGARAVANRPCEVAQTRSRLQNAANWPLWANKHRRQIIVVTHDANIVVNGDAEYVATLDFDHAQTRISEHGGLQESALREAVCEIMEGGRSAFEQRYQRGRHL